MNKKALAALVSTLAFGSVTIAHAEEAKAPAKAPAKKGDKKGEEKKDGDGKKCGADGKKCSGKEAAPK